MHVGIVLAIISAIVGEFLSGNAGLGCLTVARPHDAAPPTSRARYRPGLPPPMGPRLGGTTSIY